MGADCVHAWRRRTRKAFPTVQPDGWNAIRLRRKRSVIGDIHGPSRCVLIEPRLELFEPLSPINVTFIEPVSTAGAAAVPSDLLQLVRRTRQLIEIGQVIRIDANRCN